MEKSKYTYSLFLAIARFRKGNYRRLLSEKLSRPVESIALNLVEIPTASNDLVRRDVQEQIPSAPTIPEIQAELLKAIALNLESLKLPAPAQLVSYAASTSPEVSLKIQIFTSVRGTWVLMESP